ncbi:deoxycytidine triphosphate deaminase [Acidianus sulfidivorans JP7]|uniref:Deoxycytidine triphosphate deaminase n=1 Tax=Acidianus sulfidivorans JP7 TaxID=619593 RepID=A0A2U9IKZ9_9CREN|nr:deoxycytidine triphosphate deaminase [Acidianus sulfidivorans]AWR96697.1 deoxycytidine triphosphate deaminase [Acidianus sulfidivorans JP7]
MILSHQSIKGLLGNVILNYSEDSVRENGYDLRICGDKYFEVSGNAVIPDVKSEIIERKFEDYATFEGGKTLLFNSCEEFRMPNDLAALITLRSTLARNGFFAPPTVIDAGYNGKITLAISSFLPNKIKKGSRVSHVIFIKLDEPTQKVYSGIYSGGRII